ncbi:hypothetical protein BKK54_03190 [Rodentibacter genomosp. 1]|uniref:DUF1508 domain-containing protein n=1 Tax=Rodentibacter genomosp. 1 TaxID=1908264 RepID=A0A1V3J896_9PAST|nr:hypothetical protein [Rodentibacter genomosp. 1]OOF51429.1 hypothetical protein BKK54_03190 [Rodentibacter genomosp. 1]
MWFEVYLDNENKWRWRLCQNSTWGVDIIATSHQGHLARQNCENEIYRVRQVNGFTPVRYV